MTDAISFFQSILTFNSTGANKHEVKLAVALKREAQDFENVADRETENAQTAQKLAAEATDPNKVRAFTEIAVWHYGRAREKYIKAAARFEEAGKIQTNKSEIFNFKALQMNNRAAAAAESAAKFLTGK